MKTQDRPWIIISYNPHSKRWIPERWGFSNEIVTYDNYYEALHDCRKGDKIIPLSKWDENTGTVFA